MNYSIILLWLLIILFVIILIKLFNIQKNFLICIICSIFIVLFVLNIKQCTIAAIDGFKLWYNAVLPVTFPFLVICNLLISYDGISLYSKILGPLVCTPLGLSRNCSFPIVASFLCGYPLGAKYSVDLWSLGYIDDNECQRLLNIASNVGPLFLIGSVGSALLNNATLGYILLIANYLSVIFIGIITNKNRTLRKTLSKSSIKNKKELNFGQSIKDAIGNGVNTILSICGFIVIFSVIISIIKNSDYIIYLFNFVETLFHVDKGTLFSIFLGSIEMTNGCNLISHLNISLPVKLGIISFLCSFSGLSVIAQISSFMKDFNVSYFKYIYLKIIQGIFSFIITYLLMKIFPTSVVTCNLQTPRAISMVTYLLPLFIFLILTTILKILYELLFHTS